MHTFCRVPVGYHWDFLSILRVKYIKHGEDSVLKDYYQCIEDLKIQIGPQKFDEIFYSDEYLALYQANDYLFDLVDMIKTDPLRGKELDDQVFVRWQKKKALQEKFFGGEFSEKKYGYTEEAK
jgi:hypothetical protein